ncbi:MAG: ATP synthase F1 subunit gamma [Faecalibacterium sp.]
MAGSMKDIKLRIKSVESTMQITKAMELVASSKLRHARNRVEKSRPYFEVLQKTLSDIAVNNRDFTSRYTKKREVKRTCYIVIAGDRGLAGGYNSNMFKLMDAELAGKDHCVLPLGKKALEHYERLGSEIVTKEFYEVGDVSVSDCFAVAKLISKGFLAGEFDEIYLGYTQFISMLTQEATFVPVLPFEALKEEALEETEQAAQEAVPTANAEEKPTARDVILYEPSSEEVFNAIIPEYIAGMIYGAVSESVASELAARRTAMDSATRNAKDMIANLNLYYNRARQASITQEITEIVAGAEA